MQLPIELILAAYPQMEAWLSEMQELFPSLFRLSPSKLHLNTHYSHAIAVNGTTQCIQISSNAAVYKKQKTLLIDWAIRQGKPRWSDNIKLWVASECLAVRPENIMLIILAVHPSEPTTKLTINWDSEKHKKASRQVIKLLRKGEEQADGIDTIVPITNTRLIPSIAEIKEIAI